MAYIYQIFNDINDKVYIGKTCQSIEHRFQEHKSAAYKQVSKTRPLYLAMQKYGIDHFHIKLLEECKDNEASLRESYWINFYQSYTNGYNATKGGDGKILYNHNDILAELLKTPNAQIVAKIFNCSIGTVYLIARANNILLSNSLKEKMEQNKKEVHQYSLQNEYIQTFESVNDAARWIIQKQLSVSKINGVSGNISNCANGKRKTAFGFIWKY